MVVYFVYGMVKTGANPAGTRLPWRIPLQPRHDQCAVAILQPMGIVARLKVHGEAVVVADPSGGRCDAAGDFDRLLPVPESRFPVLAEADPHGEATIANPDLVALADEVTLLLRQAVDGPERRGLLRLRALALEGHRRPGASLSFIGD
jgi:hypothetical protein